MTSSLYPNSIKIRHPFLGYTQSKKTRAKISKTLTGRKLKSTTKKKLSIINKGNHHTEESKIKMSILKKKYLKKHPQYPSEATKRKIRNARLNQKFLNHSSQIEIKIQQELKNRQINFKTHIPIICCIPDIFIAPNICIFVDGDFWHANPKLYKKNDKFVGNRSAKTIWKKDKNINNQLIENNYKVLRFWETDINKDISSIGDRIEKVIMDD